MILRASLILALTSSFAFASAEENVSQQFDVAPGGNLVVDVGFGSIDVVSDSGNSVAIEAHRKIETNDSEKEKRYLADAPIVISKEGNTVTVRARSTEKKSWDWTGNTRMDGRYAIRVPKKFNLDLRTSGGSVSATDVAGETRIATSGGKLQLAQLKGPVDARTSGGTIRLNDCDGELQVKTSGGGIISFAGGGSLDARTSGGSIEVRNFNGDALVKTSGGQLEFENVRGKLSGKTSGGSISAALVSPLPGEVDLASAAGSIVLEIPRDAALNLDARTSVGSVANELPIQTTRREKDELSGTINGGGKSVVLRSSAGSISIRATAPKTAMQ